MTTDGEGMPLIHAISAASYGPIDLAIKQPGRIILRLIYRARGLRSMQLAPSPCPHHHVAFCHTDYSSQRVVP